MSNGKSGVNALLKGQGKNWQTTAQESVERVVVEVKADNNDDQIKPIADSKPSPSPVDAQIEDLGVKAKKKLAKVKSGSHIVEINDLKQAEFKGQFLSTQRGHPDFKQVNTHMPKNIELLVKQKMLEDGLSMVELTNLLFVSYVESGLSTNLIKRYKKVSSD